ncbi:MAG: YceI family protein [Dehalococcoidia bacterium]
MQIGLIQRTSALVLALGGLALIACAAPATQEGETAAIAPVALGADAVQFTVANGSSTARYQVTEQLAGASLPNDAIGTTRDVAGTVAFEPDGRVIAEASKIVVGLNTLASDQSMRDMFIRQNTLQTSQYPTAQFVLDEVRGLAGAIPASGSYQVELVGDLTIHGVTRPAVWTSVVAFSQTGLSGSAETVVRLTDFGMTAPNVARVLSIEEEITLRLDFEAQRA